MPDGNKKIKKTNRKKSYQTPAIRSESVFGHFTACTLTAGTCDAVKGGVAITQSA